MVVQVGASFRWQVRFMVRTMARAKAKVSDSDIFSVRVNDRD
jgi:hypothetical protein